MRAVGRRAVTSLPLLWLLLFFLVPFLIVLKISFAQAVLAMPPYTPLLQWSQHRLAAVHVYLSSYRRLAQDGLYLHALAYSLKLAALSTLYCLLLGYPMAYGIARARAPVRNLLLMLVVLPFWTSFLLRVYAWIGLLRPNGVVNQLLLSLGIIHTPLVLLQTDLAVYIGIVYSYLPFMILPLYANLEKHDAALLEAAADLGAQPWRAFLRVTLPLSLPGIVAGSLLVFIPAVGEYVIPTLLGPQNQLMIGRVLSNDFFNNRDWPMASVVAILLLLLLAVPVVMLQHFEGRELRRAR